MKNRSMRPHSTLSNSRALAVALLLTCAQVAQAQLPPVGPLTVSTATVGAEPNPANGSVTYSSGVTFTGQRRVVGSLNANMPANTTLQVRITGGAGGTSLGYVVLNTTPRDIVIAASQSFFSTNTIAYTFTALVAAGVIPTTTRVVTFTLLAWP